MYHSNMRCESINDYNLAQRDVEQQICIALMRVIDDSLPEAERKIWHAHPVWFLNGNPIVGYGKLKHCIRLMFWSGQSFNTDGLNPSGTFKAAERRYTAIDQIDHEELVGWLKEAIVIQWDYKNIQKRRGRLERLI